MSQLKSKEEIARLGEGGRRLAQVLKAVAKAVKPGVSTAELNALAERLIRELGDLPAFLHYQPRGATWPFPAALCTSINDEIVHGIPSPEQILKDGDIVGLDLGLCHDKLYTDMAITVPVGKVKPELAKLLEVTEVALAVGIKAVRPGNTTGDIGFAIEQVAKQHGFGVVRELSGHGVGHAVHEEPNIPNYGKRGTGTKLKEGMVIAIEPMLTLGSEAVDFLPDGYTSKTADGLPAAHFEKTVAVTATGAQILTA